MMESRDRMGIVVGVQDLGTLASWVSFLLILRHLAPLLPHFQTHPNTNKHCETLITKCNKIHFLPLPIPLRVVLGREDRQDMVEMVSRMDQIRQKVHTDTSYIVRAKQVELTDTPYLASGVDLLL